MSPLTSLYQRVELQGLIISVLLHGAVLSLFIVSFPLLRTAPNPTLTFFGSILSDQDFVATAGPSLKDRRKTAVPADITVTERPVRSAAMKPDKPVLTAPTAAADKPVAKTVFPESQPTAETKEGSARDLGIEPSVPQRIPLKLYAQ